MSASDSVPESPPVSIGMPVFNSAAWIEESVESILAQSCGDFELIISDNASTDGTLAICERFAAADPRIRLLRNSRNIGANRNYLATLAAARGKYFKWASSNDWCAPTFLEKCIAVLEADPSAVLAYPRASLFERALSDARAYDDDFELLDHRPAMRLIALMNTIRLNNAMNGVVRRQALLDVSTMGSHMGADIVLMAELALKGKFVLLSDRLFCRRMSRETATRFKSAREAELHLVPSAREPLRWQYWRFHWALLRSSASVEFLSRDWFQVVTYALRAFVWSRSKLAQDAVQAIR